MMEPEDEEWFSEDSTVSPHAGIVPRTIQHLLDRKALNKAQENQEGFMIGNVELTIFDIYNKTVRAVCDPGVPNAA